MNTADRSLALLDTALRRRFSFVPVYPDETPLREADGIDLKRLLKTINNRITALYDREHCIGHSYFMDVENIGDLAHVFENKILPLLEEYFFEDVEKIRHVLGGAPFFKREEADVYLKRAFSAQPLPEHWVLDGNALNDKNTYLAVYPDDSENE